MNIFKHNKLIIVTCIMLFASVIFSQNWDSIGDAAYDSILANRYNKGNILVGFGGNLNLANDYKVIEFSIRSQAGYFIANKWLFNTGIDFYHGHATDDNDIAKAWYNRLLINPGIRYYFKPRHRAIFIEAGPIAGKVKEEASGVPDFKKIDLLVYGGKAMIGLSVFIRRFELEIAGGAQVYSSDYTSENIFSAYLLQLNLSYIFDRQHNKSTKPRNRK
jgi:hypothetical protein